MVRILCVPILRVNTVMMETCLWDVMVSMTVSILELRQCIFYKNACAPIEDSDQHMHPHDPINL